MKPAYGSLRLQLAALLLFMVWQAQAQAWRPFRPGLIYAYHGVPTSSPDDYYTLRVDSAYATASGDSVYAFNRVLRASTAQGATRSRLKSRNNLFGALMRWRPGQSSYTLEAQAQANVQTAVSLTVFPRAAVGSTWPASTQPLRTATVVSRNWQTVSPGVQDSVATISITNPAITICLSRRYGLVAGPQWLGGAPGVQLETGALLPAAFEQSVYSPLRLFDVQPGDEFGYQEYDIGMSTRCYDSKVLRRIIGRRQTADSLIITYLEQRRYEDFGYPGVCFWPAHVQYSPVAVARWKLARRGMLWLSTGIPLQLGVLSVLTGEYVDGTSNRPYLLVGMPISDPGTSNCGAVGERISYVPYYQQNSPPGSTAPASYQTGLDYDAWQYSFFTGLTTTAEVWQRVIYSRKTVNGVTTVCGTTQDFVTMLPSRSGQGAALATLHPNPATENATLTLTEPARASAVVQLSNALGQVVWRTPVSVGQRTVVVPLSGQAVGLYVLRLLGPSSTVTWKLTHE